MIDRDYNTDIFTVYCAESGCSTEQEYDTDGNWSEMIEQMKAEGWSIQKQGEEWFHRCPGHE